jgi:hypothetical protein
MTEKRFAYSCSILLLVSATVVGCATDSGEGDQYQPSPGGGSGGSAGVAGAAGAAGFAGAAGVAGAAGFAGAAGVAGQAGVGGAPPLDSGVDADTRDQFGQVDIVILVDNSGSMLEEQQILATQFFNLVNALVDPARPPECRALDNVRIGVITSDMGLQSGESGNLPVPAPVGVQSCPGLGDDAAFQVYPGGSAIDIQPGVISCNDRATQCPQGWTCENIAADGVGGCQPPGGGDGLGQSCPAMTGTWTETRASAKNQDFAFQTACLADAGTDGCGFEQQLKALTVASARAPGFLRENALLALIVISDEEDCSLEDIAIFGAPEFGTVDGNLACGRNAQYLYSSQDYRDQILALKGGREDKVVFAGIVGVPLGTQCEGFGNAIPDCLSHDRMQLTVVAETTSSGITGNYFAPACERYVPADSTDLEDQVTKARPGRRYVELAQAFGDMGYVSSICNEDWTAVMEEIAKLITCSILE